ncbi:MAG: VTT domain-containing protein [Myxococcales bacterium]|nr:VTT domain-containing protein [Myxococcales bacterium]
MLEWLRRRGRPLLSASVLVMLVGVAVAARQHGVDRPMLERELVALGCFAGPLFVVLFTVGELIHLPGILFVVAARVVFGPGLGAVFSYLGALVAVTASFALARMLLRSAKREPWRPKWAWLAKIFAQVEARPVRTIALLRVLMMASPPLNYALAVTNVRTRDYVLGSAIGLVIPVLVVVLSAGLI